MKLNEKIYHCRKQAGLSQEALAERIGVSRQAISKWETGEASPEISKLPLLAQTFAVTTDWLLDDAASPAADSLTDTPIPEASGDVASERTASYPDWVDKLPGFLSRMIRRYGWLVGVRMAISGALFLALGFVALLMSSAMSDTMSMMGGFGGGSVTFYDEAGNAVDPSQLGLSNRDLAAMGLGSSAAFSSVASGMTQPFDIFCGFIILLGLVMLVGGALLAWQLKKWGEKSE